MRNKHGFARRGVLLPAALPGATNRRKLFEAVLRSALSEAVRMEPLLARCELTYDDIPPSDPMEWEDYEPVLCRAFKRQRLAGSKDRIVFYRLPLQRATRNRDELSNLVTELALTQVRQLFSDKQH